MLMHARTLEAVFTALRDHETMLKAHAYGPATHECMRRQWKLELMRHYALMASIGRALADVQGGRQ